MWSCACKQKKHHSGKMLRAASEPSSAVIQSRVHTTPTEQETMKPAEGRKRVVIEDIQPQVNCGRHPARRFLGDRVTISAAIFSDGHDHVAARLLYRPH